MDLRNAVIAEARTWCGTRFSMNVDLKGVGTDCGRFPRSVYSACGFDMIELPAHWPRDFMCHAMADSEPYLALIQQKLIEVAEPLPGDLAVFKPLRSRCYSHAAIVVDWPNIIHARGVGCNPQVEVGIAGQWPLEQCPVKFFSPQCWHINDPQKQQFIGQ